MITTQDKLTGTDLKARMEEAQNGIEAARQLRVMFWSGFAVASLVGVCLAIGVVAISLLLKVIA